MINLDASRVDSWSPNAKQNLIWVLGLIHDTVGLGTGPKLTQVVPVDG